MNDSRTNLVDKLAAVWQSQPQKAMLVCSNSGLNYNDFIGELAHCKNWLSQRQPKAVALLGDNSVQWVLIDIACQLLNIPFLPLPGYFSSKQLKHSIESAGCDLLLVDNSLGGPEVMGLSGHEAAGELYQFSAIELPAVKAALPKGTAKITFTSGSTGEPKGVCLSHEQQWQVAKSIKTTVNQKTNRHLCILPLATLLENVAGVYSALLNGTTVVIPSLSELGFSGSSSLDFIKLLDQISQIQPSSLITNPEILGGLVSAAEHGWKVPDSLNFVPVGGARVAPAVITRAQKAGIEAYQGYGLSECASVVSLNTANGCQSDTMGKVLPHTKVSVDQGEVYVHGNCFLGYANQPESWGQSCYATGDMGYINEQGYLTITGRRKNLLISSFGRNINPEWLESELLVSSLIAQAFVFGEGKPYCVAALYPASAQVSASHIEAWIQQTNRQLPDYAQIKGWFLLPQALKPGSKLLTANGRPKRGPLQTFYQQQINQLYTSLCSALKVTAKAKETTL